MEKDRAYEKVLKRMLTLEHIGEFLYRALILKAKDDNLRLIYDRLALNERETAGYIEKEILAIDKNHPIVIHGIILNLTRLICGMLTAGQLAWILKCALKRRIYSKWYNRYKDHNQDFWYLLLNHENLQRELLRSYWNN